MLDIASQIATLNFQVAFDLQIDLRGFTTNIYYPVVSESMYNDEGSEFQYPSTPDLENEILLYANYMDVERHHSASFMDSYSQDSMAYTKNLDIPEKARLSVPYQGKSFEFTVEEIMELEFDDLTNGVAIRRLMLEPLT